MTYNNLTKKLVNSNEVKYFSDINSGKKLFRFNLQLAKCQSMESADFFVNNLENCNFLFARKDDTVRQPLGLKLYSHYFDIETFNSRIEEFGEILKVADSCGFKGHNAKNLILRIYLTQRHGFSNKVRKKIDMFVNLHPLFFKTISRRIKKDIMVYSVDKDYQQFGQSGDSNRSPVLFGDNEIVFQMFRSTTNINTILATIELCYLVVDFCDTQITIDELIGSSDVVQKKFNDYIQDKSLFFKHYMQSLKINMTKENNYYNENLNNGFTNCSDIQLFSNLDDQNFDCQWDVFNEDDELLLEEDDEIFDDQEEGIIRGVDYNGDGLIADCCDDETTEADSNEDGVVGMVNESIESQQSCGLGLLNNMTTAITTGSSNITREVFQEIVNNLFDNEIISDRQ